MIKQEEWEWFGHAGHFCGSSDCVFQLSTKVGEYLVSTVGDYFPLRKGDDLGKRRALSLGDSYFETMVFKIEGKKECSCPEWNGSNLDCKRYPTEKEAHKGHMEICEKWSKK